MGTFRFRLARLLRARTTQEGVARAEWAAALHAAETAEAATAEARAQLARARSRLSELVEAGLAPAAVLTHQEAIDGLQAWRTRLAERAAELRARADALRTAFDERRRERRSLERLEERDREAWRRAEALRESARMDEIASARNFQGTGAGRPPTAAPRHHPGSTPP